MCPGPWKCSPTSSPTWASPPNFPWFFCYFIAILQFKKAHISLFGNVPWTLKMFPNIITNSEKHPNWTFARLNIFVVGLFICICLHISSFPNNPTNKVYILQKQPCHLDQNWWSCVEIFILVKIDMLNIFVFGLFICICLHILCFQNTPTNNLYILQKRPCYLDQNWRSYVEIFISAKIDD